MAGRREIKCIGPSAAVADRKSAVQRAVNLYMSQVEGIGEDLPAVLESAPGLDVFLAITGKDLRGQYNANGRWFVAAGDSLYEVYTDATSVWRGTLASASGPVGMKSGRDQLVIVDGPNGYVFRLLTNTFAQITDPDWRGSNWVDELDGYFIFADPNSDQFYLSAIDDATALDALDFSSADAQPDNIITHRVRKRELHLFGALSVEIWIDSGDADFPLTRYNSTPIDVGIVGEGAVCLAADSLCWVGQTDRGRGYVYEMQGHQPVRISTQAVEQALASSSDLSLCTMWSYHVDGGEFVGINAPGMQTTWVYDFSTRQWHERGQLIDGDWHPWPANFITHVDGAQYAGWGDTIYRLNPESYAIAGTGLARERTWPHLVAPSLEPVSYRGLEVACTTGSGGTMTLEVSNDGGYTFGPPLLRSLGADGRWMQRVRWLMLGAARDRVFRLRCTDAVPLTIHSAAVDS